MIIEPQQEDINNNNVEESLFQEALQEIRDLPWRQKALKVGLTIVLMAIAYIALAGAMGL